MTANVTPNPPRYRSTEERLAVERLTPDPWREDTVVSPLADHPQAAETPHHRIFDRRWFRRLEQWVGSFSKIGDRVFFPPDQFAWAETLEVNWSVIRAELDSVLQTAEDIPYFQDVSPRQKRIAGDKLWKTYYFYALGEVVEANCDRCPQTWALIKAIPGLKVAFFSILSPGKHIPEHRGKYKGLLRYHLALKVPQPAEKCRIRVHDWVTTWEEGKSLIFDDTYYHEVWNETAGDRVVLFLDLARPLRWPLSMMNALILQLAAKANIVKLDN